MSPFEQAVRTVQFLAVDAVEKANSGHPGAPMGLAGIGVELFSRQLRYDPSDPNWPNRDRFVLSCGHASMLLYALLHLSGYELSIDDLKQFRQLGSKTPGHPEYSYTPGVETTTGPLGQGIGNAVGMALASKMAGARVNAADSALIDYRVFTIVSDGDLMEGVSAEAASLAGHLRLDNLIAIYDDNQITIDGGTELSMSEDVGRRFEAYGWFVQRVDGHDPEQVRTALDRAVAEPARPSLLVARTQIGKGAPTKQGKSSAHGAALGAAEVEAAKKQAGWPLEPTFYVPNGVREFFADHVRENQKLHAAWRAQRDALTGERRAAWDKLSTRAVPADLFEQLLAAVEPKADATRSLSAKVQQRAAALVSALVGGSADLAESVKTLIKDGGDVAPGSFAGRNLHFGVREHGMASILNGLALSGFFVPYGSTFLIFSDYMRPAIRLAALMKQQVIYVFSHDSIFLGEDGPTHQPIEQLASLRLVPNLRVMRPADAPECAAAWAIALERDDGPTALVLTRQKVPVLERPKPLDPSELRRGAYIVQDSDDPEFVLIATGSEVSVAIAAAKLLTEQGRRVRVVSAPCWELFEEQPAEVQASVLGVGGRRVAIEAGRALGWRSVVGRDGLSIGIERFGISAPGEHIAPEVGLTGEKVVAAILREVEHH
jgi:transketolase